jgi:tagatose-6-phosphate ketose/aldose isomerase
MDKNLRNLREKGFAGQNQSESKMDGAFHTQTEIGQQPQLWLETYNLLLDNAGRIKTFMDRVLESPDVDIILTGAGSSAFIGKILEGTFTQATGRPARAIATTDILTHPLCYINKERPVLLVSFARSGNSPESTGVVSLVSSICDEVFHLVITCNPSGKLAKGISGGDRELILLLPEATDDKSLVMTSSFTCMLVAGVLIARINDIAAFESQIKTLAEYGEKIIEEYAGKIENIAQLDYERIVFLGSGPLLGAAEESQLKVQELTDGKVMGKHDSYLGFRHGPKAMINPQTLIVYLFSNDPYVFSYEWDLVKDVNSKDRGLFTLGVIESSSKKPEVDCLLELAPAPAHLNEALLGACSVLLGQLLGFYTSLKLGLKPDNPSKSGTITRIVEGVNIYPYNSR